MSHMELSVDERRELAFEAGKAFSPSAPIDERALFAGRDKQVTLVLDAIHQKGQHVIIYGERGVGKTSLANVLSSFLSLPQSPVACPRVNCDVTDTFDTVWRKVFEDIEILGRSRTMRLTNAEEFSAIKSSQLLSGQPVTPDNVRRVLTFLATGSLPILIIDEFDRLPPGERQPFADTIKTLSDHAVGATVILVGVSDSVEQLVQDHQSVQRALVQIRMPRMSSAEIERIIRTGLDRLHMSITPEAMRHIRLLAQGLPHYAHLLGLWASRAALDAGSRTVTSQHVRVAIDSAVEGAHESISSEFHNAVRSPRKDNLFTDVLIACALAPTDDRGTFAAQDVRAPMRHITGKDYEIPSFQQHLSEFCDPKRGPILKRTGTPRSYRYQFKNPLIQPFAVMKGVTSGRISSNLLDTLRLRD
jgi:Cdc6-like AAA superfamily ATPase